MGFQNLRNNNTIYILHKNETPVLEIGKITNISLPIPKYMGQYTDTVVDISANVDGNINNFQKVPSQLEIADVGSNIVISCSKNAINDEVLALKLRSEDVINSTEYHKNVIAGCNLIIKILNPEIAEKEQRDLETQELREEISSLKSMVKDFINQFKN